MSNWSTKRKRAYLLKQFLQKYFIVLDVVSRCGPTFHSRTGDLRREVEQRAKQLLAKPARFIKFSTFIFYIDLVNTTLTQRRALLKASSLAWT